MILVTGGTGLVGSHLLLHLLELSTEEPIRAIYRNQESQIKTKNVFALYKKETLFDHINWIKADITDVPSLEIAFQNITKVYHCAAIISFDPDDEQLIRKVNIEGTANIVNFSLQYNIQKLCFVSSIAALGDLKEHEKIITEETEWNAEKPHSDYAISKYGAEMEIWRGQQEGLNVVIVNPGVILGPGFWSTGSGRIIRRTSNGLKFYTKGVTGFVSVIDVVNSMRILMQSETVGERYIVVSENVSFQTLQNEIAKNLDLKSPSIYAEPWMSAIYWRLDWFLHYFFGKKRLMSRMLATSLHSKNEFSNIKIKSAVGFEFESIRKSIGNNVAFFKRR